MRTPSFLLLSLNLVMIINDASAWPLVLRDGQIHSDDHTRTLLTHETFHRHGLSYNKHQARDFPSPEVAPLAGVGNTVQTDKNSTETNPQLNSTHPAVMRVARVQPSTKAPVNTTQIVVPPKPSDSEALVLPLTATIGRYGDVDW